MSDTESKNPNTRADEVPTGKNVMFSFRLPRAELDSLEQAAATAGMPISEYLRKVAGMRPDASVLAHPQYGVSIGTTYSQSGTLVTWSETTPNVSAAGAEASREVTEQAARETQATLQPKDE
jgi:Mobilization protein NikA